MFRSVREIRTIAILLALGLTAAAQQRNTAGIYGRVTDQQGAAVGDARVTLTHTQTGVKRTTQSNGAGEWEFPSIPVGAYSLIVEKSGFSRVEQKDIVLQVNDNRRADVALAIGAVTTTVTVEAPATSVNTSDATLKDTIDSQRVVDLPLNGRDLADLAFLAPGVQSGSGVAGGSGDGAKIPFASRRFSIDGSRQNTLSYTLDGGDNQDTLQNTALPFPFPDAVQEFSVETNLAGVTFGKNLGGSVNIVTKSGTNSYHGDVFWFVRNTDLDANNFFSHVPDNLKQNQAGLTAGGPILKNKLFVFGGYQETSVRALNGSGTAISMPAAHRTGNFSDLLSGSKPVIIDDPTTKTPFPGNIIPTSRLSPAAQNLLTYAPVPGPNGLVYYAVPNQQNAHEWILRTDYRLNDRNSIYLRLYDNHTETPPQMDANNIFSSTGGIVAPSQTASLGWTYTPAANMVVDTHLTANQYDGDRTYAFPGSMRTLGVNVNPSSNAIGVSIDGTSNISLGSGTPAVFARANIELVHSWQWVKGRHSMVWGANIETSRYNEYNTFDGEGVFAFNGEWSGYDQADYLLGQFSSFTQGNGEIEFKRLHYFGFYWGDTFRATPRLSLSFGVRWEPYFPITDLNNRIDGFSQAAYLAGTVSQVYLNAPAGMLFPGDKTPSGSTIPAGVVPHQLDHFAPRLGIAYDLLGDGKTILRTGYGIYYDTPEMFAYNNMNDQSPFSFTVNFLSGDFDDPYAGRENLNVFPYSGDFQKNSAFPTPFSAVGLQNTQPLPYEQSWNIGVDRQLASDLTLRVTYVGSKGTHLWGDFDDNAPIYNFNQTLTQNLQSVQARRPRQAYQGIDLLFAGLNQEFNSLQASLNKRFTHGLNNQLSYTWSKNIDYLSSNNQITSNTIADPFNFFEFRGPSDFDRRQRFVDALIYDIPDAGQRLGSRFASAVLGKWRLSGIVTAQSGSPFTIVSTNSAVASAGTANGELIAPLTIASGRSAQIAQYFNTSAVAQASAGTYGNLGRNSVVGPGYLNTDASLSRSFHLPLGEAGTLTFRGEAFNLFNRPDLANPGAKVATSTFGVITATSASPRILQLSLKVLF